MTSSSSRPRVICHMAASVDGRVVVDGWPLAVASAAREDFRAPGDFDSFAFAIDPSGRLAWETNDIDGDHVVAILSERVSDEYLAFLRARDVSYLLARWSGAARARARARGATSGWRALAALPRRAAVGTPVMGV